MGGRSRTGRITYVAGLVAAVLLSATACAGVGAGVGSAPAAPPPPPPGPVVTLSATAPISPTTPVVVASKGGRLTSVVMTTPTGHRVNGATDPAGDSWTSAGPLAYDTSYAVVADAVSPAGTPTRQQSTVRTVSPKVVTTLSTVPASGSTVGVGQPLAVRFSHAVDDKAAVEKALAVTVTPPQPGAWHWISASQVDYRPQSYWKPGTTVDLAAHLFGVDLGDGAFGGPDIDRKMTTHDAWVAKADGGSKQMQIFDNGALVKTMNISLGSDKFPTHTGVHVISDKQPSVVMDSATYGVMPGQPGYYKETVLLDERISNDGEFVHAAPWSVGQQGNDNVSHGCVNLSPADAQWFYDHFGIGDVVEVTNSGGPTLPIYDTWGDWALPWSQWSA